MSANHHNQNGGPVVAINGAGPISADEAHHLGLMRQCAKKLEDLYEIQRTAERLFETPDNGRISHVSSPPLNPSLHSAEFQFVELELHLRSSLDHVQRLAAIPGRNNMSRQLYDVISGITGNLLRDLRARMDWEKSHNYATGHVLWPLLEDRVQQLSTPPYSLVERLGGKAVEMWLPLWTIPDQKAFFYFGELANFTRCVLATMAATSGRFDIVELESIHRLIGAQTVLQQKCEELMPQTRLENGPTSPQGVIHYKLTVDAYATFRNAVWQATYLVAATCDPDMRIPETLRVHVEDITGVFHRLVLEFLAGDESSRDSVQDIRAVFEAVSVTIGRHRAALARLMELRTYYLPPPAEEISGSGNGAGGTGARSLHMVYAFNHATELSRINELLYRLPPLLGTESYEVEMYDICDNPVAVVWRRASVSESFEAVRDTETNAVGDMPPTHQFAYTDRNYIMDSDGIWWCGCMPADEISRLVAERDQNLVFGSVRRVCTCLSVLEWLQDDPGQLRVDVPRRGSVVLRLNPSHVLNGRRRLGLSGNGDGNT